MRTGNLALAGGLNLQVLDAEGRALLEQDRGLHDSSSGSVAVADPRLQITVQQIDGQVHGHEQGRR